jgi:hypothetical protein
MQPEILPHPFRHTAEIPTPTHGMMSFIILSNCSRMRKSSSPVCVLVSPGFPCRCNEIALANLPQHWHCENFHTPDFPCLLDYILRSWSTRAKKAQLTHERVEYNVFLFDELLKGSKSLKIFKISLTFRFDKW